MKIPILLMSAVIVTAGLTAAPASEEISQHDRDRLLSELYAGRKMFLDSLQGVSAAQWKFKAGPDRWSIQEVAEHIATAEPFLRGMIVNQVLKSPPNAELAAKNASAKDAATEGVLKGVTDRTHKLDAPEPLRPKDIYPNPEAAIAAFDKERNATLDYVRTTHDSFRDHFVKGPTGVDMDGVQWMMLLAGHTERHVAQIQEVKQSPNYPKL